MVLFILQLSMPSNSTEASTVVCARLTFEAMKGLRASQNLLPSRIHFIGPIIIVSTFPRQSRFKDIQRNHVLWIWQLLHFRVHVAELLTVGVAEFCLIIH